MLNEAYIGLGSNLGDSAHNLRAALDLIRKSAVDLRHSPLYITSPQGFRSQPAFYNAACRIITALTPFQLMQRLLTIEKIMGRRRVFLNAPRILDLDLLLYGRLALNTPPLILPHPRMEERLFVLRPLADIAPRLKHPISGIAISDSLRLLPRTSDAIFPVPWQ